MITLIAQVFVSNIVAVYSSSKVLSYPGGSDSREPACQCRRHGFDIWVRKISLEKGMATHSSILAWKIPWTEVPGGLQSTGIAKRWTQLSD